MSAGSGASVAYQDGPQSAKPLESNAMTETRSVRRVPGTPPGTARFVTHLVPNEPMGTFVTVRVLAERWEVCTATVYALAKAGKLPSIRVGNSVRFRCADVEAYEASREGVPSQRSFPTHPSR